MSFHDIPSAKTDGGNTETNPLTLSLLDVSEVDSTAELQRRCLLHKNMHAASSEERLGAI